jgi:hypothetical protein
VSLNLAGSAAFTASVMTFVIGSTVIAQPGGHLAGGLTLAACAVLAAAFAVIDRRAAAPLLPRPLLGSRKLRDGAAGSFLNTATTSSAVTLVTLYLQNTLHRSPLQAAAALIPFSLAVIAGSSLSAVAQRRQRPPLVVAEGLAMIALADGALIWSPGSAWAVPLCAAAAGTGIGLSSVAATGLGTDVGPRWRGGASGIVNTAAQLGTAVGVAVLLLVAAATSGVPAAGTGPPRVAWAVAAVAAAAGAARFASRAGQTRRPWGSGGSAGIPPHPQGGRLAEDQAARRARVAGIQPEPGEPGQQGLDRHLRLQPGQVRAQAEMRPVREGEVAPGVRPADVECVRVGEHCRIPVGPGDGHGHLVAGPDAGVAESRVSGRVPVDDRRGGLEPQRLLDRRGHQAGVGEH